MVEAARAGKAIFCEKPVSLDLAEVDRALAAVQEAGVPFQIGFNRRFDPGPRRGRRRRGRRHGRRAAARAHLQPRPGAAADGLHRHLGRDLPRHDDPRLRHGALRGRQRGRRGLRARRGADRPGLRRRRRRRHRGGHARARERLPDDDRQLAPGRLRLRPARRGLRLGRHGDVGEPARARGGHPHARGRAGRDAAVLLPRALHPELPARVGGVHRRGRERHDAAGRRRRRPRAAGDRAGRVGVAARGRGR